jgi:gluconolactonase
MNLNATPVILAEHLAFPEGPVIGKDGRLYFVEMEASCVSRLADDGTVERWVHTGEGGAPNGLAVDGAGNILVAEAGHRCILSISPDGTATTLHDRSGVLEFRGPNDLALDPEGGFYFTDPVDSSKENRCGTVFYAPPRGAPVQVFASGWAFPNGLALTADARAVIIAETQTQQLWRMELAEPGRAVTRELFCQLPEVWEGLDGMAFSADGHLFVAHYGMGVVHVIAPEGQLVGSLPTGGINPTNCCFGGPGFDQLFVTEAETGRLVRLDVGVKGLPLFTG